MTEIREELARAATMRALGRFDAAATLLARLGPADPGSGRAGCLFARAHLGTDRFADAVEAANRAASIEPTEEWPHRLPSHPQLHPGDHAGGARGGGAAPR